MRGRLEGGEHLLLCCHHQQQPRQQVQQGGQLQVDPEFYDELGLRLALLLKNAKLILNRRDQYRKDTSLNHSKTDLEIFSWDPISIFM